MIGHVKRWARDLLVRSQQYTHLDNVYLARGGFWTTLQFGVGTLASVATVIAFANLLPRETYGIYKYLLSLAGTFGFLALTGMNTAVIRAVAQGQTGILRYAIQIQLRYNLLYAGAIGIAAAYYASKGNFSFAIALGLLAISLPLSSTYDTYRAVLTGQRRFDLLAFATSASALLAAAAVITGLLFTDSIIVLLGIYGAATLLPNIVGYRYVLRHVSKSAPTPEATTELRRTGFHLTAVGVIGTLAQYLDKILLFQATGPAALAVYGFAIAGPDRLNGLMKNWIGIGLPKLASRTLKEIRGSFYQRLGLSLLAGGIMAASYILLAPTLFRIFLPKYLDAIAYSQVYVLGQAIALSAAYVGMVFTSQNMLRAIYISSICGQSIRILLLVLLGWQWGVWGIVLATVFSRGLAAILSVALWEVESRRMVRISEAGNASRA